MEVRYEIERRYLVRVVEGLWKRLGEGHAYRQGYVKNGTPSVRIRIGETRGPVLTCKSGKGVKRQEVETVVSPEVAEALMRAAGKRVIQKVRWSIGPWELDRFEGALVGLTLLEIELDTVTDPVPNPPDGVIVLGEVTEDKRFTNGYLARLKKKEQKVLVRDVYREWGR